MSNLTVRTMIHHLLVTLGYDGLCTDDCGCELADLMPCDLYFSGDKSIADCVPGHAKTWIEDGDVCHGICEDEEAIHE